MIYLYHSVQDNIRKVTYDRDDRKTEYERYLNVSMDTFVKQVGSFDRDVDGVTFDDGYCNNKIPVEWLHGKGYSGMVFVSTSFMGKEFRHCSMMMLDCSSVAEISDFVGIGSHGVSHLDLTKLDDHTLHYELFASKMTLEYLIHKEVEVLSYPYGKFDDRVKKAARDAGYKRAYGTWIGDLDRDEFSLSRKGACTEEVMK